LRKLVPLALLASIALSACGDVASPATQPSGTPEVSTGFGTEPTREVQPQ
jgi:hypothetical protein